MQNKNQEEIFKKISKMMSLILRHQPEFINAELDENGWMNIRDLLGGLNQKGIDIDLKLLKQVVLHNDKKRFRISEDQLKIRASQGHSVDILLNLEEKVPPDILYHGTVAKFKACIQQQGLQKKDRQYVHLSSDYQTAEFVAKRRGAPVVLKIQALKMHQCGYSFFLSENDVWLVKEVPFEYILF